MYEIRNLTSLWAEDTYKESLLKIKGLNDDLRSAASDCFGYLNISDKPVNGYACENLPKTEEGHTGIKINYSDVFHELLENDMFTPTMYLVRLIELFGQKGGSPSRLNGFIARGIRTLTSFLREPDFAFYIGECLKVIDPNAKTNLNPRQDSGDHTDVLLEFKNKEYRIWLFQFSARGLPHDIERITGIRGELPNGIHVLCPLRTELAIEYDKKLKKHKSLLSRVNKYEDELNACSPRANVKRNYLIRKIADCKQLIKNLNEELSPLSETCSAELDILNGWFFYSDAHIRRIASIIQSSSGTIAYDKVVAILKSPEIFLSRPKIFIK